MEVAPGRARREDLFLHVIEVGDNARLAAMSPVKRVRDERTAGVRIRSEGRTWTLCFAIDGDAGGHIRIEDAGRVVVDRTLAGDVAPQVGLLGTSR